MNARDGASIVQKNKYAPPIEAIRLSAKVIGITNGLSAKCGLIR
jgi:hypothetical protein